MILNSQSLAGIHTSAMYHREHPVQLSEDEVPFCPAL